MSKNYEDNECINQKNSEGRKNQMALPGKFNQKDFRIMDPFIKLFQGYQGY